MFLKYQMKMRPNYFIFIGYLKTGGREFKRTPEPLWIRYSVVMLFLGIIILETANVLFKIHLFTPIMQFYLHNWRQND